MILLRTRTDIQPIDHFCRNLCINLSFSFLINVSVFQVALLDYGQVKNLPDSLRLGYASLIIAIAENNPVKASDSYKYDIVSFFCLICFLVSLVIDNFEFSFYFSSFFRFFFGKQEEVICKCCFRICTRLYIQLITSEYFLTCNCGSIQLCEPCWYHNRNNKKIKVAVKIVCVSLWDRSCMYNLVNC